MRLLLNNYRWIAANLTKNTCYLASTLDSTQAQPTNQQNSAKSNHQDPSDYAGTKNNNRNKQSRGNITKKYQKYSIEDDQEDSMPQIRQDQWQISASHLISNDFDLIKSKPGLDLAKKHLKNYEQSLGLSMDIIRPKLYNEEYYKRRLAEFHLNSITPLTKHFLNQGINFLNKESFYKLIQSNKIGVLRELLERGAFEKVDFITPKVVDQMFQIQYYDQRNQFLLNVLSYETSLVKGTVAMKDKLFYKNMRGDMQRLKSRLTNSTTLNKLRLLWSFSKLYLYENNLTAEILHELNKVTFTDGSSQLLQVKRESNFISGLAFSQVPFNNFISKLLKQTKTFPNFMRAYSLSIILLSKLLSIHKPLQDKNSNQLHPALQLIQYNLPKQQKDILLSKIILQLLSHEDHSRIHYENYKKCYNYWLKDYTQPTSTEYHSPLSRLLQKGQNTITIIYQQRSKVSKTGRSVITIARSKRTDDNLAFKSQSQVINSLLQGKYQVVLDYFLTTFALNTDQQLASQFQQQINKIQKTQHFHSKDQEALLKLKAATRIFFRDSLPDALNLEYLQPQKQDFASMCILQTDPTQSSLPLNIDRDYKNLKYRMALANKDEDDQLDQQNENNPYPQQKLTNQEQSLETQEQPLTDQQKSLRSFYEYLSLVLDQKEAQLAIMTIESSISSQNQPYKSTEAIGQELNEAEDQIYVEQDEGSEGKGQFSNQSYTGQKIINVFASDLIEDLPPLDNQRIQFDQAYFQLPIEKNRPRFQFIRQHRTPKYQRASQPQYKFNKRPTKQSQHKFFNKKKSLFSTMKPVVGRGKAQFSTQVQLSQQGEVVKQNLFDFQRIQQYRVKPVDQSFLQLMKSEVNIPKIGSGTNIAKYLFLHSKKQGGTILNSNRTLNIEFMSSIGTKTTNYEKYLKNSLFNYELEDNFYEQMLLDQLKVYNRFEFKQIIAHLINFKQTIKDSIIDVICQISEKEAIGYTFVQIVQFIKINNILISSTGLKRITRTWYRFDIINEDMLSFLKEYCYKTELSMQTQYYASYCKSLIKRGQFDKLQVVCTTILTEIRPKPFRVESSMKPQAVSALEKEWKERQQENYIRLFFQLIEVIVNGLRNKVPSYMDQLFNDYRKLKPVLNERELGYAFVCYCQKRPQFELLLALLQNDSVKGTSFMYDCLLKALLSNFSVLEDLNERMLEATVFKNRIVLNNSQVLQSLVVFKRSSSANSFSSFLQHCLRFQDEISTSNQIKREMYYILNNNVNQASVGGVFNLLDFIFNQKRQKERDQYRKIRLSEEEKQRKLQEIQKAKTKAQTTTITQITVKTKTSKKKQNQLSFDSPQQKKKQQPSKSPAHTEKDKEKTKKPIRVAEKQKKRIKKQAAQLKIYRNSKAQSYVNEQYYQQVMDSQTKQVIESMRGEVQRSLTARRGCLGLMDGFYGTTIDLIKQEEQEKIRISEQAKNKQQISTDDKKGGKGGKANAKNRK